MRTRQPLRLRPWSVVAAAVMILVLAVGAAPQPTAAAPGVRVPGFSGWEVQVDDISRLGSPRPGLLVKAFSPSMDPVKYLDKARQYGQKVLVYFTDTVDYSTGRVYPARIPAWVAKVKSHPALYGYLSVKEPSWSGVTLSEMRSLYSAYKAADSSHPVVALLGDTPHFGQAVNPWSTGVANVLWVDWYPVTIKRGYLPQASTHLPKVRAYVDKVTPGTPIWLMVQGHGYKKGDLRVPTSAELRRQVADGFRYLRADGIAFYTWNNTLYESDFRRNPSLWATARQIISDARPGVSVHR